MTGVKWGQARRKNFGHSEYPPKFMNFQKFKVPFAETEDIKINVSIVTALRKLISYLI